MEENVTMMTILTELKDFRAENNKRWEANDKRWEENEKRWKANDKRWEENEKRLASLEGRMTNMEGRMTNMEGRMTNMENQREKDKIDLVQILDTMQKSIDKQLKEFKDDIDKKMDRIENELIENRTEHAEFRKLLKAHNARLDFYGSRISSLEQWRDDINNGGFVGTY